MTTKQFTVEQVDERLDRLAAQFADVTTAPGYGQRAKLETSDGGYTSIYGSRNLIAGDTRISIWIVQNPDSATTGAADLMSHLVDEGGFHPGISGRTKDEVFPDRQLVALKAFITGGAK